MTTEFTFVEGQPACSDEIVLSMPALRTAEAFRPSGLKKRIGADPIGIEMLTKRLKIRMIERHAYPPTGTVVRIFIIPNICSGFKRLL
jgi:hypothetical protein